MNPLRSFLTVAFPNSGFTQPAYFSQPDKQATYSERVLFAFRSTAPTQEETDVFTGLPISGLTFDVDGNLEPGKTYRQHIPLTTGQGIINFHPYGDPGIPVSGVTLLAFQAFPLGSAKCGGRMLAVHSDNSEVMLKFANYFLEGNRRDVHFAKQSGSKKMPEHHLKHRTLLIDTLIHTIKIKWTKVKEGLYDPFSLTAYHLTNSGQGVDLAIYHLPNQMVLFLGDMVAPNFDYEWGKLVNRAWELPKLKKGQTQAPSDFKPARNWLYEDIFLVADNPDQYAPRFIRTYFLRTALRYAKTDPTDPRNEYSIKQEADLVSWKLTERFIWRILHMEQGRINKIKELGETLANYVKAQNDRRFFRSFYIENKYDHFRIALLKANLNHTRQGNPPLITLDQYLAVFEESEEFPRIDWKLARDLVLIYVIECLYQSEYWQTFVQEVNLEETTDEVIEQLETA